MSVFEINKSHLVGKIADFPIEVVERMVYEQINQSQKPNPTVFTIKNFAGPGEGGFSWALTEDGYAFWEKVIRDKNFDLFFSKYPKKTVVYENKNFVCAVGYHNNGKKVIDTLVEHGGVNKLNYTGDCEEWLYYIEPNTNIIRVCDMHNDNDTKLYEVIMALYTPLEIEDSTVEVSMEDIAKMMGIDVSDLRIKK